MDSPKSNSQDSPCASPPFPTADQGNYPDFLALSLRPYSFSAPQLQPAPPPFALPPPLPPQPSPVLVPQTEDTPAASLQPTATAVGHRPLGGSRRRTGRNKASGTVQKSLTITPPYEWATNRRATVHNLSYLLEREITVIRGSVQCRRCERQYEIDYDLEQKFHQISFYIAENKDSMRHRAPRAWTSPQLLRCRFCAHDNTVKPVISAKKRSINWLFLFLGQFLGLCTLEQLKYFCKHTENHRTGAKNRVLYLTYMTICQQLDPSGPFNP